MSVDKVKANINLYAIFKNLEYFDEYGSEVEKSLKGKIFSVQFMVKGGPMTGVVSGNGGCRIVNNKIKNQDMLVPVPDCLFCADSAGGPHYRVLMEVFRLSGP